MKRRLALAVAAACLLTGCSHAAASTDGRLRVVATTAVIADMAREVAGDAAIVEALVPPGADPHSYEPSLRDVRKVAYADVAFSNYLLLEQHSVIKTLDSNLRKGKPNVALAEASTKYGAEVIPLVENVNLDALWLGLRVQGTGKELGATRASEVALTVTGVDGPGQMSAYLTETFGRPRIFASSHDGFNPGDGYAHDTMMLPTDAHTHMTWAFTAPGLYRVRVSAVLRTEPSAKPVPLGEGTVTFVVGTDPRALPELIGRKVLNQGHADVTVDLDHRRLGVLADKSATGDAQRMLGLDDTVVSLPPKTLTEIPGSPDFRFLGKPGSQIYQLPQAVLGAHVHGEIDPHLWLSVRNAKAYVKTIQDTLATADPAHASTYAANANRYQQRLTDLDREVADTISRIPEHRRHLVTTHDAYAYFAKAYGLQIAGFVTFNPGVEPSLAQRRKVSATIRQLQVPAVFLEPTLAKQSSALVAIANETGVAVCTIRSDAFDREVTTYEQLMRANAREVARCLG